jgi:hypothetical protein
MSGAIHFGWRRRLAIRLTAQASGDAGVGTLFVTGNPVKFVQYLVEVTEHIQRRGAVTTDFGKCKFLSFPLQVFITWLR